MKALCTLFFLGVLLNSFSQNKEGFDTLTVGKFHLAIKPNSSNDMFFITDTVTYFYGNSFQIYTWIDGVNPDKISLSGSGCSLSSLGNAVYLARVGNGTKKFAISSYFDSKSKNNYQLFKFIRVGRLADFEKLEKL